MWIAKKSLSRLWPVFYSGSCFATKTTQKIGLPISVVNKHLAEPNQLVSRNKFYICVQCVGKVCAGFMNLNVQSLSFYCTLSYFLSDMSYRVMWQLFNLYL